jgi:hypothetical protein
MLINNRSPDRELQPCATEVAWSSIISFASEWTWVSRICTNQPCGIFCRRVQLMQPLDDIFALERTGRHHTVSPNLRGKFWGSSVRQMINSEFYHRAMSCLEEGNEATRQSSVDDWVSF